MLTMKKSITITGQSLIEGKAAENYQAVINDDRPEDMTISKWQGDKALYKANRAVCRKDAADFEEAVYAYQDTLIEAKDSAE